MTAPVRVLPYGPRAVLIELGTLQDVMAAVAVLRAQPPAGTIDVVPTARTILVTTAGNADLRHVARVLDDVDLADGAGAAEAVEDVVVVRVRYDGIDLTDVAARAGCGVDDIVTLHSSPLYSVAFCGFMPGFSYLVGLHPQLHLPRLATPRSKVPAGAVAIASEFTAVYPAASPGGWHLLGTTDAVMWDESRDIPALLPPGTRVRFEPA